MSTFWKAAVAAAALVIAAAPVGAQRHQRHSRRQVPATTLAASDTQCTYQDCGGDYSLNVVSARYPYADESATAAPVLTLVVENSGADRSPASEIAVAPRGGYALVKREVIPALAPGERTVVKVPLSLGPDGFSCVSISISAGLPQAPATAALASAPPSASRAPDATPTALAPLAPVQLALAEADPDFGSDVFLGR